MRYKRPSWYDRFWWQIILSGCMVAIVIAAIIIART